MLRLQKQWVLLAGGARRAEVRGETAAMVGCDHQLPRGDAGLPRCRKFSCPAGISGRWLKALGSLPSAAAVWAAPATAEARDGAAGVVEDGARTLVAAPRPRKAKP